MVQNLPKEVIAWFKGAMVLTGESENDARNLENFDSTLSLSHATGKISPAKASIIAKRFMFGSFSTVYLSVRSFCTASSTRSK